MGSGADAPAVTPFPIRAVVEWLEGQGVAFRPPVTVELIAGGRSNLTYTLTGADGHRVVLRRPPFDGVLESAHDMGREWRFISALGPTPVPVPAPLALADRDGPLGVPFYVMSHVEGAVLHDAGSAGLFPPAARKGAAHSLIDTMVALHAVDIDEVGLGTIAKREDYLHRQLRRWKRQWDQSSSTDIAAVDEAFHALSRAVPEQEHTAIVHGDFRLGNTICGPDGTVLAVLDWELATLGDPLADLGWLLSYWLQPGEWPGEVTPEAPPSLLPGFPTRASMLARYHDGTGTDLSGMDYYIAFSHWRSACISGGVLTRYESGVMGADGFDPTPLRQGIIGRAAAALALLA
jgi:aminoglycoside phosphotransferase (APT) family kinase protein